LIDGACRFITECGAYTNPEDRAILGRADFSRRQARGIAAMYADLAVHRLGWTFPYRIGAGAATPPIAPVPVVSGPGSYAKPVPPPVWDGRDKEVNGVTFRAVRRVVMALQHGLPALQFADVRARPVRAPIGQGETFEVLFVVEGEAGPWWVTTSGARVPMAGTAPRVTIDDAA